MRVYPSSRTARIDMALTGAYLLLCGVVDVVTREMQVEAILATEIKQQNPQLHERCSLTFEQLQQRLRETP